MRVLLTGAAGFIGAHVAIRLVAAGHEVLGVDSYEPQVHAAVHPPSWITPCSVADWAHASPQTVRPAPVDVDVVVHLAARVGVVQSQYEVYDYITQNVGDTAALLQAYVVERRCRRFIVASSMSVYGEGLYYRREEGYGAFERGGLVRDVARGWDAFRTAEGRPVTGTLEPSATPETKLCEPASVYAQSKLDQETYTRLLGHAYGIETVALRFFGVYGQGQALANPYTGVLAQFACRVLNGEPPLVHEDGQQTRDFIHVSDVAAAVVAAVETAQLDGIYNVCTGAPSRVIDLATKWCEIAAAHNLARVSPEVTGAYRVGDIRHCYGEPERFQRATGWSAQVGLSEGMRRVATWILANHFNVELPVDHSAEAREEMREHGLLV